MSGKASLLKYTGLAAGAGGVVYGSEQVIKAVRANRARLVLVSCDASERTVKQITDKCAYYKTECIRISADMYELAHATGKSSPVAVCAVTNRSLAEAAKNAANNKE